MDQFFGYPRFRRSQCDSKRSTHRIEPLIQPPAQKWLKDRKGRTLGFDDILHYQKMIVALVETNRLMKEIDLMMVEP